MAKTAVAVSAPALTNKPPASGAVTRQAIDAITGSGNGISFTDFFLYKNGRIIVDNTTGSAKDITLINGTANESINAIGDNVIEIAATTLEHIDQIESSMFKQTGDDLYVEFETGMTGYCYALADAAGLG
jgi:hypothetical protein